MQGWEEEMTKTFFTSDLHFFHGNIIQYCNRPWTAEEQTQQLIDRWNSKVGYNDTVYVLGDFALGGYARTEDVVSVLKDLNGEIKLVLGNHDSKKVWHHVQLRSDMKHVEVLGHYAEITIEKQKIILSHFPFAVWNGMHWGAWHLHGHSHGSYKGEGKMMDVGVDTHPEYSVYSFHEIKERLKDVPIVYKDHHNGDTK